VCDERLPDCPYVAFECFSVPAVAAVAVVADFFFVCFVFPIDKGEAGSDSTDGRGEIDETGDEDKAGEAVEDKAGEAV